MTPLPEQKRTRLFMTQQSQLICNPAEFRYQCRMTTRRRLIADPLAYILL